MRVISESEVRKLKYGCGVISVFGKSRKSCKIPILRGRKFVRILASLARLA